MNNSKELQELRTKKQYLQEKLVEIEAEINSKLYLSDEYILAWDFDGDGIVSYIDYYILNDVILKRNHSSLYDPVNNTYNGKSLDLTKDEKINITDMMFIGSQTISYLKSNIPMDIDIRFKYYNKQNFSQDTFIYDYCISHNGEYPSLDELKAAYNAA